MQVVEVDRFPAEPFQCPVQRGVELGAGNSGGHRRELAGHHDRLASLPGRQSEFREGVKKALDYAAALDCRHVHCMAGIVPADN